MFCVEQELRRSNCIQTNIWHFSFGFLTQSAAVCLFGVLAQAAFFNLGEACPPKDSSSEISLKYCCKKTGPRTWAKTLAEEIGGLNTGRAWWQHWSDSSHGGKLTVSWPETGKGWLTMHISCKGGVRPCFGRGGGVKSHEEAGSYKCSDGKLAAPEIPERWHFLLHLHYPVR